MKSLFIIILSVLLVSKFSFYIGHKKGSDPVFIEASKQRNGDAKAGYTYLTEGDYLKSGIPFSFFKMVFNKPGDDLGRNGLNQNIPYSFNAIIAPNGEKIVSPNCLQCHAQEFNGKFIIGMGNSLSDYTNNNGGTALLLEKFLKSGTGNEKKLEAARNFIQSVAAISPF